MAHVGAQVAEHFAGTPPSFAAPTTDPAAVAVDLGSGYLRIWASDRRLVHARTSRNGLGGRVRTVGSGGAGGDGGAAGDGDTAGSGGDGDTARLIRRGRITDPAALEALLIGQLRRFQRPLAPGAVVVACRPVLAARQDEEAARQVLTRVFAPSRILFLDSVMVAAIGAGASPGPMLVADVGADLTEVALLADGRVLSARRADLGTTDLTSPTAIEPLVHTIIDSVRFLSGDRDDRGDRAGCRREHGGLLLVGGGARARLAEQIAAALGMAVRRATNPSVAAVRGAGLAALAVRRRTAGAATA